MNDSLGWQIVHHEGSAGCTERLRLEHGWLIRTWIWSKNEGRCMALTFVPDFDPPIVNIVWPPPVKVT